MATEEEIRRQVEADVAKFVAARDAGQSTAGIGRPLDRSQFTAPITPEIASDLIGRSQTVGVPNSEFDKYGGYRAVKDVYDTSVQTIDLNLPTRPSVDTTTPSLAMPNKQTVASPTQDAINKLEQEKANNAYINELLYEKYLGRSGSPQELSSYANIFGPEVDQDETRAFILGGVKSGELTQDQADKFLSDGRPAVMGGKGGKGGSNFSVQRPPSNVLANQQRQMDLERSLAEQNAYQNLRYDPNISQRYRQPSYMNFQNYDYGGFSSPYNYQFQQPAPSFAPSYYSPYVNQFGADQYYQQPYSPYQQPYSPYQSSYQPMPAYSQPIGRGKGGFQQPFQPNFQQPFQPSFQSNFQQPFQSNFQPSFQQPPQSSFQFNSMGGGGRPASFGGKGAPASMGGKR
jgi:hypothetical protein